MLPNIWVRILFNYGLGEGVASSEKYCLLSMYKALDLIPSIVKKTKQINPKSLLNIKHRTLYPYEVLNFKLILAYSTEHMIPTYKYENLILDAGMDVSQSPKDLGVC